MKKIVTIIMLCGVMSGYAQSTPPYAASTQTWKFGGQTWSDAIHIPECNRGAFYSRTTEPECRSYTEGFNTWYYYNWTYVNANKNRMCPSPWRVPTHQDFKTLKKNTNYNTIPHAWGFGGRAFGWDWLYKNHLPSMDLTGDQAWYWSTDFTDYDMGVSLNYDARNGVRTHWDAPPYTGMQVRCVK
jgi:uncharacterized protein (TIGR02145 family)